MVAVTAAGLAATVAQLAVLREVLVLFHGIELFMGPVLACWLIWNGLGCSIASRYAHRLKSPGSILGFVLSLAALIMPLTLFLTRFTRSMWYITPGELPGIGSVLGICLVCTAPPSLISGALFGFSWLFSAVASHAPGNRLPLIIYVGEAVGAGLGGIVFYVFLSIHQPLSTAIVFVSSALILAAGYILLLTDRNRSFFQVALFWLICTSMVASGVMFRGEFETATHKLQWGDGIIAVEDTPYQNLTVIQNNQQRSVFSNGSWRFSVPDQLSEELAVHPALLQHPQPHSVLMLGSNGSRTAVEVLRHNKDLRVDVIEIDPGLAKFEATYLSPGEITNNKTSRIRIFHEDAARFIRQTQTLYQVILMNLGDPINAGTNRFYTISFFRKIQRILVDDGVFALSATGGEDMLGEDQIIFLKSILHTLEKVFPKVIILPGERIQFIVSKNPDGLLDHAEPIIRRMHERRLSLAYVRPDTLQILLDPFRQHYFNAVLKDGVGSQVNTDTSPICYQTALRLITAQWHPRLKDFFFNLFQGTAYTFWGVYLLGGGLVAIIFFIKKKAAEGITYFSVGIMGALTLVIQMVLLLAFQNVTGMVYLHMVLIVAAFMVGLSLGAGWVSKKYTRRPHPSIVKKQFIVMQALLFIYPLSLIAILSSLNHPFWGTLPSATMVFLFTSLSLLAGILGGLHFSSAAAYLRMTGNPATGGYLYAVDLVGAAVGVLLVSLYLIPMLGPLQTLPVLSVAAGICLVVMIKRI